MNKFALDAAVAVNPRMNSLHSSELFTFRPRALNEGTQLTRHRPSSQSQSLRIVCLLRTSCRVLERHTRSGDLLALLALLPLSFVRAHTLDSFTGVVFGRPEVRRITEQCLRERGRRRTCGPRRAPFLRSDRVPASPTMQARLFSLLSLALRFFRRAGRFVHADASCNNRALLGTRTPYLRSFRFPPSAQQRIWRLNTRKSNRHTCTRSVQVCSLPSARNNELFRLKSNTGCLRILHLQITLLYLFALARDARIVIQASKLDARHTSRTRPCPRPRLLLLLLFVILRSYLLVNYFTPPGRAHPASSHMLHMLTASFAFWFLSYLFLHT